MLQSGENSEHFYSESADMIFEGNVKYFSGLFLLAWPTKRQHGIQHHSSDFTAGLQHEELTTFFFVFLNALAEITRMWSRHCVVCSSSVTWWKSHVPSPTATECSSSTTSSPVVTWGSVHVYCGGGGVCPACRDISRAECPWCERTVESSRSLPFQIYWAVWWATQRKAAANQIPNWGKHTTSALYFKKCLLKWVKY